MSSIASRLSEGNTYFMCLYFAVSLQLWLSELLGRHINVYKFNAPIIINHIKFLFLCDSGKQMCISLLATRSLCHQFSCTNSFYLQTFSLDDVFSSRASNQSIRCISGWVVPPVERCGFAWDSSVLPDWVWAVLPRQMEKNWCPDLENFVQDVVVPSCLTVNSSVER